ncbi:sugar ABC transporter substrate-binding protein [Microbacterium faecale]|uniref:Sugar ABC transporter substrate-binding protein n=1 Tax=Microbacterium faecale TaxID=1804630 RepID=A0A916Y1U8_9MICO|nr:extracellular solute-binding protein [Microbacterium faecale]GGD26714.1 sugar ABC transporter substrate-binding protein [Microbacterium faecale]
MTRSKLSRPVTFLGIAALTIGVSGCAASEATDTAGVTISVVDSITSEPGSTDLAAMLDACGEPEGITIAREQVPSSEVVQKVLQRASSQTLPDLLQLDNPDVVQFADIDALHPLADFGIDLEAYNEGMLGASTLDGDVYGLAPSINTLVLFYNKDLLAEAGVDVPATWDELRDAAAALTTADRYGFSMSATASYEGTWQFLPYIWSNGGDEKDITSPETVEALEFVVDLMKDGSMSQSVVGWGQGDVLDQFTAGEVPLVEGGIWTFKTLNAVEDLNWGVSTFPTPDGGNLATPLGGKVWTLPVTGDPEKAAAAAKILECLNSDENQTANAESNGAIPSNVSVAAEFAKQNELDYIETSVEAVKHVRARTRELGVDWPATATAIHTALQSALTGQQTAEEALNSAASTIR